MNWLERFADLAPHLLALERACGGSAAIARQHYYHPSQRGGWSIKAVLPALCPDPRYSDLDGVQDGGMAQQAYLRPLPHHRTKPSYRGRQCGLLPSRHPGPWLRLWAAFANTLMKKAP